MSKNYLIHYGVLGMKWGVRRTPERTGKKKKSLGQRYMDAVRAHEERTRLRDEEIVRNPKRRALEYGKGFVESTLLGAGFGKLLFRDAISLSDALIAAGKGAAIGSAIAIPMTELAVHVSKKTTENKNGK